MAILGIDTLLYGVDDVRKSTRFFEDFGLRLVESSAQESRFELPEGSRVMLRPLGHPSLPQSTIEGPGVREVIWGVHSARSVEALARDLGVDRKIQRDEDGTIHFVTDFGGAMGLREFTKKPVLTAPDPLNSPGRINRLNQHRKWRLRAYPKVIAHVVFALPEYLEAAAFMIRRLDFRLSDSQRGFGEYLRANGSNGHHTLLLLNADAPIPGMDGKHRFHHANFGVEDIDEIMVGANHMTRCGWEPSQLGLGRHRIDSALFYYLPCPAGGEAEYGADADCLDDGWVPREFIEPLFAYSHFVHNLPPFLMQNSEWNFTYITGIAPKKAGGILMAAIGRALVVGGGIGGLTAAVALRRAGIAVDLVEIKHTWAVYGVGIIQPNNVMRALDRVGLAQDCVDNGGAYPGWRIFSETNDLLFEAPASNRAAPSFPPYNGITRPILQTILQRAAISLGTRTRLGVTVKQAEETDRGLLVTCTDDTREYYDLLVAADGINSATRSRIFGDAIVPRFTGQAVWRYNFTRPADMTWGEIYYGSGTKVGLVPMSPTLMYMFLVTAEPANPRMPPDQLADLMRDRLGDYTGRVATLRKLITDAAAVVYKPMETLLLPQPWSKGRQVIIGDAAHATTPHLAQGAAMAIEDAVLLGELLPLHSSLPPALEEFMARRFKRAKYVVDCSNQIAGWELEQWNGVINPAARPGELLHEATLALLDDY